jgi:S-adenosylmethionine-diacylglycerol 3-amino-3-carboxypropyl transferase
VSDAIGEVFHKRLFGALYQRTLLFNTCWEDPAVDRRALAIGPGDTLLVITSAGCNVLDYALAGPRAIHAVDANPRQTALLELKLAAIRRLDFSTFFEVFGLGRHRHFASLYREALRPELSPFARQFWDHHQRWFLGKGLRGSFYWHGLSGLFAYAFRSYVAVRPRLKRALADLVALGSLSLAEQGRVYRERVEPLLWTNGVAWALRSPISAILLGVPWAQRRDLEAQFGGDLAAYIRRVLRGVFEEVGLRENYFWTLYLRGHYTAECCPEYLKRHNFERLKGGLADRIHPRTATVTEFLRSTREAITKFVLLDHLDWLSREHHAALVDEWQQILARAGKGARVIFRSGAPRPVFLDRLEVPAAGRDPVRVLDRLRFYPQMAAELSRSDRVRTYASFHVADILAA